jgi:hypothetical protein
LAVVLEAVLEAEVAPQGDGSSLLLAHNMAIRAPKQLIDNEKANISDGSNSEAPLIEKDGTIMRLLSVRN